MQKALNYALKILAKRDYTEKQIKEKLVRRDVPSSKIEEILQFLKHNKFIDDLRYATSYIHMHQSRGEIRLKYELIKKGISNELIDQTLVTLDDQQLIDRAKNLSMNWLNKNRQKYPDSGELKNRLFSKLSRQGFSYNIIKEAWEDLNN